MYKLFVSIQKLIKEFKLFSLVKKNEIYDTSYIK